MRPGDSQSDRHKHSDTQEDTYADEQTHGRTTGHAAAAADVAGGLSGSMLWNAWPLVLEAVTALYLPTACGGRWADTPQVDPLSKLHTRAYRGGGDGENGPGEAAAGRGAGQGSGPSGSCGVADEAGGPDSYSDPDRLTVTTACCCERERE